MDLLLWILGIALAILLWLFPPRPLRRWINRGVNNSSPPGLSIGDLKIDPPKFWSSKNTISFSLWYLGNGLAFVESILIDVLDVQPFKKVKMTGAGATPQEYRYRLILTPEKGRHRLNKSPFFYKNKDIDTFRVELVSPGGFRYKLRVCAEWQDKSHSKEHRSAATEDFIIEFPVEDIDEAIRLTTSTD